MAKAAKGQPTVRRVSSHGPDVVIEARGPGGDYDAVLGPDGTYTGTRVQMGEPFTEKFTSRPDGNSVLDRSYGTVHAGPDGFKLKLPSGAEIRVDKKGDYIIVVPVKPYGDAGGGGGGLAEPRRRAEGSGGGGGGVTLLTKVRDYLLEPHTSRELATHFGIGTEEARALRAEVGARKVGRSRGPATTYQYKK